MTIPAFRSTKEAACLLGVRPSRLATLIYEGRLPQPARLGRALAWSNEDITRAARLLGITMLRPEGPGGPDAPRGLLPVSTLERPPAESGPTVPASVDTLPSASKV